MRHRRLLALATLALACGDPTPRVASSGEDAVVAAGSLPGPTGATAATSAAAEACVARVNALRATKGLPALQRWVEAEGCAADQARRDSVSGRPHDAFGRCGESAQCECPAWSAVTGSEWSIVPGCLDMMWDEGPGGGHHDIMVGGYTQVACGFHTTADGRVWAVQDYR